MNYTYTVCFYLPKMETIGGTLFTTVGCQGTGIQSLYFVYWNKLFASDSSAVFFLSRAVSQRFVAVKSLYGLLLIHVSWQTVKQCCVGHIH